MSSTNASSVVRARPGATRRRIANAGANDLGREEEMVPQVAGTKRAQDRLGEIANGVGSGGVGSGNETGRQKRKRMGEGASEPAVAGLQIAQMASSAMPGSLSSSSSLLDMRLLSTDALMQYVQQHELPFWLWPTPYSREHVSVPELPPTETRSARPEPTPLPADQRRSRRWRDAANDNRPRHLAGMPVHVPETTRAAVLADRAEMRSVMAAMAQDHVQTAMRKDEMEVLGSFLSFVKGTRRQK